jgi:hypothetical protein
VAWMALSIPFLELQPGRFGLRRDDAGHGPLRASPNADVSFDLPQDCRIFYKTLNYLRNIESEAPVLKQGRIQLI